MQDGRILQKFSLSENDLLGFGGESRVYAIDGERVLRVYNRGAERGYVNRLREFYRSLNNHGLPFETPVVLEIATEGGLLFTIERRIQGRRLTDFLKEATGEARTRALVSYVQTAARIKELPFQADRFGELLVPEPLLRPAWPAYLAARARRSLSQCEADFAKDVPGLADIVPAWEQSLALVAGVTSPQLVHGDYFPGNLMVDSTGSVTAVIDFSPMSVAGDYRLDILCALILIEVDDGFQPGDSETVRRLIAERHGEALLTLEDVYRTYYCLYFSPVKNTDPRLYEWCVAGLNSRSS